LPRFRWHSPGSYSPFFAAVLWGTVIAILFAPLFQALSRSTGERRTLAALLTLVIVVVIVILPVTLIVALLLQEASSLYEKLQSGQLGVAGYFQQIFEGLPAWVQEFLRRVGVTDFGVLRERLSAGLLRASQVLAAQAVNVGQNAVDFAVSLFVMLYLLFFLLRDGEALAERIKQAIPLRGEDRRAVFGKFAVVIRATVKGSLVVALVQGALGGLAFWALGIGAPLLWAVLMALLSLLPAIGAGLVWAPVGVYLLLTDETWRGALLLAYGLVVVSVVDNVLRPFLVGNDIKMPDYVVLISTLGGLAIFGANGIVLGPVIAAMFIAAWDNFIRSRNRGDVLER
jgi:predicted PurR-regulated permease PerM